MCLNFPFVFIFLFCLEWNLPINLSVCTVQFVHQNIFNILVIDFRFWGRIHGRITNSLSLTAHGVYLKSNFTVLDCLPCKEQHRIIQQSRSLQSCYVYLVWTFLRWYIVHRLVLMSFIVSSFLLRLGFVRFICVSFFSLFDSHCLARHV